MPELTSLLRDAPPGEIDAVRHDIEILSGNSIAVKRQIEIAVAKANVDQLRVVEVSSKGHKQLTVLSKFNQLDDNEFFTAGENPVKFEVDHLTRKTTVLGDYEPETTSGNEIKEYQTQVEKYVTQHYAGESVAAVFPSNDRKGDVAIVVIGRKSNPQNFFNGQITAVYTLDKQGGDLSGEIKADVHYFEEGNVRLDSSKKVSASAIKSAKKLAESSKSIETKFEEELNSHLIELNEREFKALRRQLPVTRQPMTWGKEVANYKLGKELENK